MGTFGIDLGTTYSCISTLDRNGNPEIIKNQADNTDTLASVVFFENENNIVVGEAAKERMETDGDRVVDCIKRQIGKPDAKTYTYFGKSYNATDISSLILKRIKQMTEEQGYSVDDVVITCPAYFGFEELEETRKAGMLAGMNALSVSHTDIVAHAMGVIAVNDQGTSYINKTIIPANQRIPCKCAEAFRFYTSEDGKNEVEIYVLQGTGAPLECNITGKYIVSGIRHNRKDNPTVIHIQYSYDVNGMIHVQARQNDGWSRAGQ